MDEAVAIHVLEHFYLWEVPTVLAEWQRILKPGGRLVLELPCMDKVFDYIVKARQMGVEDFWAPMTVWALWGDPKYQDPAMCHRWGYTKKMLEQVLTLSGWQAITHEEPRYHLKERDMRVTAQKGTT